MYLLANLNSGQWGHNFVGTLINLNAMSHGLHDLITWSQSPFSKCMWYLCIMEQIVSYLIWLSYSESRWKLYFFISHCCQAVHYNTCSFSKWKSKVDSCTTCKLVYLPTNVIAQLKDTCSYQMLSRQKMVIFLLMR